jgi:two-component system sensor histidine kinase BaeS
VKLPLVSRLVLSYLLVILIGIAIAAPLSWVSVEQLYLNTQSASLLAQAQLVAAALQSSASQSASPVAYSQTMNALPGIHTHVLNARGAVVIDLPPGELVSSAGILDMPLLEQNAASQVSPGELLQREEIVRARAGKPATAVRSIQAAGGTPVLYAAVPVMGPDGSVTQIVYLATPLPDTRFSALPENVRWLFAGVLLAAVLVAGLAGALLARQVARPLGKLADAARAVSAGNLDQAVPEDGSITELAVLGQAFNHMTANLRQSDQAKTAFISDVTHELRTPLTVIKGTIETLQDGALNDLEARGPFLMSMSRETERLIRLVNDLLVLTRVDAGVLNLQRRPLNLEDLARSRCTALATIAAQRQVSLVVKTDWPAPENQASPAVVLADADRMSQVFDNLLDNAIRYAPPGSSVIVSLAINAGRIICRVSDSGPGIAPQHLPLIFERFYRADSGRSRGQGGSGLGLSIVRSLVQLHGGDVTAASQPDRGTTITISLPAAKS